ncbi:MAG: MerR family transcriptional regulator [Chloroflexota bacterium]
MFRIGEFSKIGQVSGHLLRYYDEIGLLKPAKIDAWTGYRYYSAEQLPRLNRILALKDLGLSLDQIRRLLEEDLAATEIRSMLTFRKAQIEQTIENELAQIRHIEARLDQIDREGTLEDVDIIVKSVPAQPFLAMRYALPKLSDGKSLLTEMLRLTEEKVGKKQMTHFAAVFYSDMFTLEDVDVEAGVLLTEPLDIEIAITDRYVMTVRELPAVETMVTVVRSGLPQVGHRSYAALGSWVEANGYRFAGLGREVFIVPPTPDTKEETLTEIQFPVEKIIH